MRVLVVEDHPIDLKLITAVLHVDGYSIDEQHTAQAAIESLRKSTPDIILLDMQLPDLAGLELIRTIRLTLGSRSIPIIAITSYPRPYPRDDVLAAGCAHYLIKPIDTRTLTRVVRETATGRA